MTKTLHISKDLSLPLDAVTRRMAILAMSGAGKSNLAVVLAEAMFDAGIPWVAIDPKGDWWGVRSNGSGKGPGLPIPIFGGLHGDVPLEPTAGHLIADLIINQRLTCVLDVSEFATRQQMWAFLHDFGERLLHENREALHLFLEEADEYIPQKPGEKGNLVKCKGVWQRVVKRGRFRGLGSTQITQRSASLDKDTLYQAEVLFALRAAGKGDKSAIEGWVEYHNAASEIIDSLPTLADGEGWVSSPAYLKTTKRVQFFRRRTFDSGATPVLLKGTMKPATLADIDLDAINTKMAATIEKAKAEDPKELQKQNRDLRAQIHKLETAKPQATKESVDAAIKRAVEREAKKLTDALGEAMKFIVKINAQDFTGEGIDEEVVKAAVGAAMGEVKKSIGAKLNARDAEIQKLRKEGSAILRKLTALTDTDIVNVDVTVAHNQPFTVSPQPQRPKPAPVRVESSGDISGPMQKILNELAELEAVGISPADKAQLGLFCGYTNVKSGGFTGPLGKLREMELIHYPGSGEVALTDAGRSQAADPGAPLTTDGLQNRIINKLDGPRANVLRQLIAIYPDSIDKATLGGNLGYTNVKSGGFTGPLGSLRKLGLIEYPQSGTVVASDLLFPPGLS